MKRRKRDLVKPHLWCSYSSSRYDKAIESVDSSLKHVLVKMVNHGADCLGHCRVSDDMIDRRKIIKNSLYFTGSVVEQVIK